MTLQGKRIYVVEDNVDNVYFLLTMLKEHGASVCIDWWASGKQPRVLGAMPLDLIILDLMLPGSRSGFEIFDELRALPELAKVPIVAVSAADPSTALPKAREKGFSGFIGKPVDYDCFPQQIAALINGEEVWAAELQM